MITRDEWLAALGDAVKDDVDAFTITELRALYDKPPAHRTLYRYVMDLVHAGKATRTWKRCHVADGGVRRQPAYLLKTPMVVGGKRATRTRRSRSR